MATTRICSVPDCGKRHFGHGWCEGHYERWRKYGDPTASSPKVGLLNKFIREIAVHYEGDNCLEWPFNRDGLGYGRLTIEGRLTLAHRAVCTVVHGSPPTTSHDAAHICGNPRCVNHRHLRWATRTENMADTLSHGTRLRGEKNPLAKLSEDQVRRIRGLLAEGNSLSTIAGQYGVSSGLISCIKNQKLWAWLE